MLKRTILLLALASAPAALWGCGPGFPIMTREQESLVTNVDVLVKENEALKKRVASLEAGGGAKDVKKEIDSLKAAVAEANASLEDVRQKLSFIQGHIEESEHKSSDLKDSLKGASSNFASINQRLSALEGFVRETQKRVDELGANADAAGKRSLEIKEAVANLEKKVSSLESVSSQREASTEPKKEGPDPEALYAKGYRETIDKDYSRATETFGTFLASYPAHKYAGNAQYWLGEIYYARGDWERAILEFDKAIKNYPKGDKVAASLLKQAYSFEKLGAKKEARLLLKDVVDRFPGSPEAAMAKKKLDSLKDASKN